MVYRFTEVQTIAIERFVPLTGPAWLPRGWYAHVVVAALKTLKQVARWCYRV
ncbi:hypothetical protein [Meiothermus rufus]|uniref:hypothetical protein n=1 Tax=Meiothermus rufus TaxID=604332 RepID=UPI0004211F84|nr:hypothetical protein [Meiothermus rufus]